MNKVGYNQRRRKARRFSRELGASMVEYALLTAVVLLVFVVVQEALEVATKNRGNTATASAGTPSPCIPDPSKHTAGIPNTNPVCSDDGNGQFTCTACVASRPDVCALEGYPDPTGKHRCFCCLP